MRRVSKHMNIREAHISVVPHKEQEYDTVGNWKLSHYDGEDCLDITVSDMGDWRYNMAVALHEMSEALLCAQHGVSEAKVTAFDVKYEAKRKKGDESEPGDSPQAPYHLEHSFATAIERIFMAACGLNWKKYNDTVEKL